jgi:Protein of unknown function (DUF1552)
MSIIHRERRRFLKGLGSAAAALPLMSLLDSTVVRAAADPTRPLRLLLMYVSHGGIWDNLRPRNTNGAEPTGGAGTEMMLSPDMFSSPEAVLNPLKDFASKMLMIEGLSITSGLTVTNGQRTPWLAHECTAPSAFTGAPCVSINGEVYPTAGSLDFALGQRFGGDTIARSLQLSCASYGGGTQVDCVSYNEDGKRLGAVSDPMAAYRLLFGTSGAASTASGLKEKRRQKAIVSALQAQSSELASRLSVSERRKLDEHLSALADLEARLSSDGSGVHYPPVVCTDPTLPPSFDDVPSNLDAHFDVLTQAFACDRVRFASLTFGAAPGSLSFIYGADAPGDMHGVEHSLNQSISREQMQEWNRWYAKKLSGFLQRLQDTSDGTGSLLDNTLVVWHSDYGWDTHLGLNVPVILFGGAQGKFRMGRYLRVAEPPKGWPGDWTQLAPHNQLLVSIMQAYGIDTSSFGSQELTGALPGLV